MNPMDRVGEDSSLEADLERGQYTSKGEMGSAGCMILTI